MARAQTGLFILIVGGVLTAALLLLPQPTNAPTDEIQLIYQRFKRGFILWRGDKNCAYIYAYAEAAPDGYILIPPNIPVEGIPADHYYCLTSVGISEVGNGPIEAVLAYYDDVQHVLGLPDSDVQHYPRPLPTPPPATYGGGPFYMPEVYLPDGRMLWCGYRAATARSCYIELEST